MCSVKKGFKPLICRLKRPFPATLSVMNLMRELKSVGAHNVNKHLLRALPGINRMQNMIQVYEACRQQGMIPATFEIIFVEAAA